MAKKKITWLNETRKLKDLMPMIGNPRKGNEKQRADLEQSLERFNLADPIIINRDGTIIGGHFRYAILVEEGLDQEVDVRVPDRKLNKREAEELCIRLNKAGGSFDNDLLANFDIDFLKMTGFDEKELDFVFDLKTSGAAKAKAPHAIECPACGHTWEKAKVKA